jgi:acyl-CoA dehydrogenase
MIGFSLTEEQQLLQKTAREFAAREITPLADRLYSDPSRDAGWDVVRPMFERGVEAGLTRLLVPEEMGGVGASALDACIVLEELGAGDVGFASDLFALNMTMPLIPLRAGTEQQRGDFIDRFRSGPIVIAGAQSEPNTGGSELMTAGADPKLGPKLPARREGDAYVLDGEKSAFITNAGIADTYFILARTAPDRPVMEGLSIFEVDPRSDGLSTSSNTELIGWRGSHHASVSFDGVRVPESRRYGPEGSAAMTFASIPEMPVCLAACFVGLARAAQDHAIAYARERQAGGKPIIEHQAVALKLADMEVHTRQARLLVWEAACACAEDPFRAGTLGAPIAKTAAVDAAIHNAQRAVEILGGYGVTREYGTGRLLNDAWIGYACDFTKDVQRIGVASFLKTTAET